jgi:taurine-pyruvate aminotransferase
VTISDLTFEVANVFVVCTVDYVDKHEIIGEVRGKGLFVGAELVKDRNTREPVDESVAAAVVSDCLRQGVMIGRTNRSIPEYNNTLCFTTQCLPVARSIALLDSTVPFPPWS